MCFVFFKLLNMWFWDHVRWSVIIIQRALDRFVNFLDCMFLQVPEEEDENEESLAHADHSKNKAEV